MSYLICLKSKIHGFTSICSVTGAFYVGCLYLNINTMNVGGYCNKNGAYIAHMLIFYG